MCSEAVGVFVWGGGGCMCSLVCVCVGGGGGCTNDFLRMEGFNDVLYFYKLFVLECVPVYTALLFIISVCADILL